MPEAANPRKLCSPREVLSQIPFSAATMWRAIAAGDFPAPIRIGARRIAFFQDEIDAFLARRAGERKQHPRAGSDAAR